MNKVLRSLVLSDLFMLSGFGLLQPIFAIFMLAKIHGATLTTIGIATSIQLLTKAILQIFIARWADCRPGNCRELYTIIVGSVVISFIPLGYLFSSTVNDIYLIQFIYGVGQALSNPTWRAIFSNYLDHGKASYEWGVYDTIVSIGTAIAAALGASIAQKFGFNIIFIIVSLASFVGTAFLFVIFRQEFTCRINFKTTRKIVEALHAIEQRLPNHF